MKTFAEELLDQHKKKPQQNWRKVYNSMLSRIGGNPIIQTDSKTITKRPAVVPIDKWITNAEVSKPAMLIPDIKSETMPTQIYEFGLEKECSR